MFRVGMSSCGFGIDEESFENLKNSGIEAIEIKTTKADELKKIKKLAERYGIDIWSSHLPFYPFECFDISELKADIRGNIVSSHKELISQIADMGVDKFVIHSSGEPINEKDREEKLKCAEESLDELAGYAHACGACIAVEDLPRTCLGHDSCEIQRLIGVNDNLRVCLDTNHLLSEDIFSFMDKVGDKIVTLHISDYDMIDEKHWLPGEGNIDWVGFYNKLCSLGYNGVWMYEINPAHHPGIERERALSFYDVYKNAMTIFSGNLPEAFGMRIEVKGK